MRQAQPKVSIIIPCHNDGKYLEEAVASARGQTYSNCEVIIVNDGSTDAATNQLLDYFSKSKIRVIRIPHSGPAAARNAGIEKAKGKYILPLDADDKLGKRYVETAVKVMEADQRTRIVYCRAHYFGERSGEMVLPEYSLENIFLDNMIFVSALFRKSTWKNVGGFNPAMREGMEDYDFWLSLIEKENCVVHRINKILFYCRVRDDSRTARLKAGGKLSEVYTQIFYNHRDLFLRDNNMRLYINHRQKLKQQINVYGEILRDSPAMKIELRLLKRPILKKIYYFIFAIIEGIFKKLERTPRDKHDL
ncbi:glycosyltransferase family 2 protein [bacterium]|nr:glycosyltransferase family 2 protein [bacterium]